MNASAANSKTACVISTPARASPAVASASNSLTHRADALIRVSLVRAHRRIENAETKLGQLNPRLVLTRGYAIVLNDDGGTHHSQRRRAPRQARISD